MVPRTKTNSNRTTSSNEGYEVYKGWVEKYSKEAGLDPEAVRALGQHESGWRNVLGKVITNRKSKYYGQQATGPLQVMPGNALPGENLHDPETNVKAGIRILGQNLKAAGGDYRKAFGSYYGWNPSQGDESTEDYIGKVMDLYQGGRAAPLQDASTSSASGAVPQEQPISYNRALQQAMYAGIQPPPAPDLQPYINYDSVKNLELSQLINFLKNPNVDPAKLKDPTYQLGATMYRWEQIKANVLRGKYTPEQQRQISSNFFDRMIIPYQQRTGQGDIRKDDWMNFAYKITYDLDKVIHQETGHPGSGGMHGWFGNAKDMFRIASRTLSFLGAVLPNSEYNSKDYASDWRNGGFWDQVEAAASHKYPRLAGFSSSFSKDADYYGFLQDLRPVSGLEGHARSMVIEGIPWMLSNLIPGGTVSKVLGAGEEAVSIGKTAELLIGSKFAGRLAGAFTNGARDGFIYNFLTRRNDETQKSFEDAIIWGAASALLHTGGEGLAVGGKKVGGKAAEGGGALYNWLKAKGAERELKAAEAVLKEGEFQQKLRDVGRREANPEEVNKASEEGVSETVAKYGPDEQRKVDNAAAAHILDQERRGLTPEQVKEEERRILEQGTPQDRILLDSVNRIRTALGEMKLSEVTPEIKQDLMARLKALTLSAMDKLVTNVPALQEALRQRFMAIPMEKLDRSVITYLLQEVAPSLPQNATQEQVIGAVRKKWADLVVEATKHAEEKLAEDPFAEALKANRQKKRAAAEQYKRVVAKTKRWTNKKNEPSVSFSYNPDWRVYAENSVRASGRKWDSAGIREWLNDLSEDDFAADLQAYFIPQFDPETKMHFERGTVSGGYDYTNLYGFAWNFRDSMPAEYADRLSEEYVNSPKMNRFYEERGAKGIRQREEVARKNSLAMWNHVDNFLGSGRFPKESNVFRSTQSDMENPTKWMDQLFDEREKKEAAVIDRMYKKDTPANKIARETLSILFKHRRAAYAAGDEAERQKISESIAGEIIKGSKGKMEDWGLRSGGESFKHTVVERYPNPQLSKDPIAQERNALITEATKKAEVWIEKAHAVSQADLKVAEAGDKFFGHDYLPNAEWAKRKRAYEEAQAERDKLWEEQEKLRADYLAHDKDMKDILKDPKFDFLKVFDYVPDAHPPRNLATIQVEPKEGGRATMWINHQVYQRIQQAHGQAGVTYGELVTPDTLQENIEKITNAPPDLFKPEEKAVILDMYNKLGKHIGPKGAVIQSTSPRSLDHLLAVKREEWGHGWQYLLASSKGRPISGLLKTIGWLRVKADIPKGLNDYVRANYGDSSFSEQMVEASIKAVTQDPATFGCTEAQIVKFVRTFFKEIEKEYGTNAFHELTDAHGIGDVVRREFLGIKSGGGKSP